MKKSSRGYFTKYLHQFHLLLFEGQGFISLDDRVLLEDSFISFIFLNSLIWFSRTVLGILGSPVTQPSTPGFSFSASVLRLHSLAQSPHGDVKSSWLNKGKHNQFKDERIIFPSCFLCIFKKRFNLTRRFSSPFPGIPQWRRGPWCLRPRPSSPSLALTSCGSDGQSRRLPRGPGFSPSTPRSCLHINKIINIKKWDSDIDNFIYVYVICMDTWTMKIWSASVRWVSSLVGAFISWRNQTHRSDTNSNVSYVSVAILLDEILVHFLIEVSWFGCEDRSASTKVTLAVIQLYIKCITAQRTRADTDT